MAEALIIMWDEWHAYDATARGSVPLGTPLVLDTGDGWSWSTGGLIGAEGHRPGALAAAEYAMGTEGGYVRDGNVFAPICWYGGAGIPSTLTLPPEGGRGAA